MRFWGRVHFRVMTLLMSFIAMLFRCPRLFAQSASSATALWRGISIIAYGDEVRAIPGGMSGRLGRIGTEAGADDAMAAALARRGLRFLPKLSARSKARDLVAKILGEPGAPSSAR